MYFNSGFVEPFWNNVLREKRVTKKRNYIRASELGQPLCDRFQSMNGVEPTNPFSDRTLRIFDAGNVIEWMVVRALEMAGILNKNQGWLDLPASKEHIKVLGRLDATIGGFDSWDEVEQRAKLAAEKYSQLGFEDEQTIIEKAQSILEGLKHQYPEGWTEEIMIEIKSISSMAFWNSKGNKDNSGKFVGYPHNRMQLYGYMTMANIRQGYLLYVSKDDLTLAEVPVTLGDQELKDEFYSDIEKMTYYYRNNETPPTLPIVVFSDKTQKFEINWGVKRSLYLKLLYGYPNEKALEADYHQYVLDVNRAYKHLKSGKVKVEDFDHIVEWNMEKLLAEA